jgi:hypothetical protein
MWLQYDSTNCPSMFTLIHWLSVLALYVQPLFPMWTWVLTCQQTTGEGQGCIWIGSKHVSTPARLPSSNTPRQAINCLLPQLIRPSHIEASAAI